MCLSSISILNKIIRQQANKIKTALTVCRKFWQCRYFDKHYVIWTRFFGNLIILKIDKAYFFSRKLWEFKKYGKYPKPSMFYNEQVFASFCTLSNRLTIPKLKNM